MMGSSSIRSNARLTTKLLSLSFTIHRKKIFMIKQTLSLKKACFVEEKEKNTDYSEVF